MHTHTKIILVLTVLLASACGKSGPMEAAADQITDFVIKTSYGKGNDLTVLEAHTKSDLDMSAKQLVRQCAFAALKYVKVTEAQAAPVAAQISGTGNDDATIKALAIGVASHTERCISLPNAYDIGKQ